MGQMALCKHFSLFFFSIVFVAFRQAESKQVQGDTRMRRLLAVSWQSLFSARLSAALKLPAISSWVLLQGEAEREGGREGGREAVWRCRG